MCLISWDGFWFIINIIMIIMLFYILQVFHSSDGLSLNSKWQQSPQVSKTFFQLSVWSHLSCTLNGLKPSFDFQLIQFLPKSLGDCSKSPNIIDITVTLMFHDFLAGPSICLVFNFSIFFSEFRRAVSSF